MRIWESVRGHSFLLAVSCLSILIGAAQAGERKFINPPELFKHPSFTRAISVDGPGRTIFIAGHTSSDKDYKCVGPGDYRAQYLQVMANLEKSLAAAGATFDDVVYRRSFVLDIDAYMKVITDPNIPRFYKADRIPGATLLQVSRLSDPCFLVEIDVVAVVN